MRQVIVSKWVRTDARLQKEERGKASFLQFAQDSEDDNTYPVAIVEFEDGTVEALPLALMRFMK